MGRHAHTLRSFWKDDCAHLEPQRQMDGETMQIKSIRSQTYDDQCDLGTSQAACCSMALSGQ